MLELLTIILNLPPFPAFLLKKESEGLLDLLKQLDNKSVKNFQESLISSGLVDGNSFFTSDFFTQMKDYLEGWNKAANDLLIWTHKLVDAWQKIMNRPMPGDDLLTATIALVPDDILILKKSLPLLDQAANFEIRGEISYALANIYSAISIKIEEIQRKEEIEVLKDHCEQYKKYIYEHIKDMIKKDNRFGEIYHFIHINVSLSQDDIIHNIIEEIKFKMPNFTPDGQIKSLIKKYLLMTDMIYSLLRENSSACQKQVEFSEKFLQHQSVFHNNKHKLNSSQGFIPYLCGWKTKEDYFLDIAMKFTQKTQAEATTGHYVQTLSHF